MASSIDKHINYVHVWISATTLFIESMAGQEDTTAIPLSSLSNHHVVSVPTPDANGETYDRCGCWLDAADACGTFGRTVMELRGPVRRCFTVQTLKRKLPIVSWLPNYGLDKLQGDIIGGLTVGLTVIPQGLAYASIAQLPPQYGLYSAFVASFIYCFLGTAKDITLGPTAIMSLMTAAFATSPVPGDATIAILLSLYSGIIQVVMSIFHVGFLMDFISFPVMTSFTTSAAITIGCGQIPKWLGLKGIPKQFLKQAYWTCRKLPETRLWDLLLGLGSMIILILMKKLKNLKWRETDNLSISQKVYRKIIWLLGTARNALVVLLASVLAAILLRYNIDAFTRTKDIPPGLPAFDVPNFSLDKANVTMSALDIVQQIGSGFAIVPLIGLVELIAIGKSFGVANIAGSFVSAYPVTGSFSRTAVNSQSGVRTTAGGLFTGTLVLLALAFLTPLFTYIPNAALAAVIIAAILDMIDFSVVRYLWKLKKLDLIPWMTTFIFSFILGIEYGILVGIGVSLLLLLYPWARPKFKVEQRNVVVLQLDIGLLFPGVEYMKQKVMKEAKADGIHKSVVMDCRHISTLDTSVVQAISQLTEDFHAVDTLFVLTHLQPQVMETLTKAQIENLKTSRTNDTAIQLIHEETDLVEDNPRQSLLHRPTSSTTNDTAPKTVLLRHPASGDGNTVADELP